MTCPPSFLQCFNNNDTISSKRKAAMQEVVRPPPSKLSPWGWPGDRPSQGTPSRLTPALMSDTPLSRQGPGVALAGRARLCAPRLHAAAHVLHA